MTAATAPYPPIRAASARTRRRVRVLHVALDLEAGGLERLIVDLLNRVDPERFESHVLLLQHAGRHAAEVRDETKVHVSEPLSRWSMIRPHALARTIGGIAPDVVHSHSGVWFKTSRAARLAGVTRIVHTDHGRLMPDPLGNRLSDGYAARRTRLIVAVSDPLAEYMRRALRLPQDKVRVVRNGVERMERAPEGGAAIRRELGLAEGTLMIGSLGRLDHIKGYDILLEAYRRLRMADSSRPPPALVIAGDGPEAPRLRAMVAAMPRIVREGVHMLGWRTDVRELLSALDVFALSSRSEGTSLSLLEAMSMGICPVVTDVGGNADVVGYQLRHRLVATESPSLFARALVAALHDADERARDAERARARVAKTFSIEAMVQRYEQLYTELVLT
ncbi:MAG TPA: glycosyltransferase [Gemmatimonadaceae bacterium]